MSLRPPKLINATKALLRVSKPPKNTTNSIAFGAEFYWAYSIFFFDFWKTLRFYGGKYILLYHHTKIWQ
jgi:hypothetical protein